MWIALNLITGHEDGGYPDKEGASLAGKYLEEQYPYLGEWRVFKVREGYFKTDRNREFHGNNAELLTEINKLRSFCPIENISIHQPINKLNIVPKLKSAAQIANEFELQGLKEIPYDDLTGEQKKRLLTLTKELRDSTSA